MRHVQKLNDKLRIGCHCGKRVEGKIPSTGTSELKCICDRTYTINYIGEAYCHTCDNVLLDPLARKTFREAERLSQMGSWFNRSKEEQDEYWHKIEEDDN